MKYFLWLYLANIIHRIRWFGSVVARLSLVGLVIEHIALATHSKPAYYDIVISNKKVKPKEHNSISMDLRFDRNRIKDILVKRGLFDEVFNADRWQDGYYIQQWLIGKEKSFYEKRDDPRLSSGY